MQQINLKPFLNQQKFLKFDYLFAILKESDSGKNLKIPIKEAKNFTDPDTIIHKKSKIQSIIKNPEKVNYPLVGVIMKKDRGLNITNKKLIVLDIDCKEDPERGAEIFEDVVDYLVENMDLNREKVMKASEMTISGGFHIFLTSSGLYPQQKLYIEDGIEIEIFSENRYMATAPSQGYKPLDSEDNCIDFSNSLDLEVSNVDLDHFCSNFAEDVEKKSSKLELNDDFLYDDRNYSRITKNWDEYNQFMEGKTDKEWDNIAKKESTYDYIRHNIMPVMALFDKTDDFLKSIKKFSPMYVNQWRKYPQKWLEDFNNDKIILGKDARTRLKRVGLFKKNRSQKRKDIIKDFVNNQMGELFESVMVVYQAIYYYSKYHKCFVYLEKPVFNNIVGLHYKDTLGMVLAPEQYSTLYDTFVIYASMFATDDKYPSYISYNLLKDTKYLEEIPISFKNGTLYVDNNGNCEFKKGEHLHNNRSLYTIQLDFKENMLEENPDSIVYDWFNTKFDKEDLEFIKMFFGNLLVPSYSPSVMLVLYSYKGALGKSTLAKTLSSLFDIDSRTLITALPTSKLSAQFGGQTLSRALINLTTELDDRIEAESFKSVISREKWEVEAKYENARYEIPLAKHISMANDVPKITADGGVVRRLGVFKLKEKLAKPGIEASKYERLFVNDAASLFTFMLHGLLKLQKMKFCDLSNYYIKTYQDNIDEIREYNSNVFEWLAMEGLRLIEKGTKKGAPLTSQETYDLYKTWCNNSELNPVRKRTVMKYILSSKKLTSERVLKGSRKLMYIKTK